MRGGRGMSSFQESELGDLRHHSKLGVSKVRTSFPKLVVLGTACQIASQSLLTRTGTTSPVWTYCRRASVCAGKAGRLAATAARASCFNEGTRDGIAKKARSFNDGTDAGALPNDPRLLS